MHRYDSGSGTAPPSLATPAVRMVVVGVRIIPDESDPGHEYNWDSEVEILSVLAISAFRSDEGRVSYEPLVLCPDPVWGIVPVGHLDQYFEAHRLVVAPWPEADDPKRLGDVIEQVRNRAMRNCYIWVHKACPPGCDALTPRHAYNLTPGDLLEDARIEAIVEPEFRR